MRLEQDVFAHIPLASAMGIYVAEYEPYKRLVLGAPLEPNLNHEGIGFGGAIECLGTLACWGLVWLSLDEPDALIVVQQCGVDFLAPIKADLQAEVQIPDAGAWRHFTALLAKHGRARIDLEATIGDTTRADAAHFHGRFVARHKSRHERRSERQLAIGRLGKA